MKQCILKHHIIERHALEHYVSKPHGNTEAALNSSCPIFIRAYLSELPLCRIEVDKLDGNEENEGNERNK
ncbi:MAG: hypothetical protein LUG93_12130 [Lachnospiraceae bacterium]|nr:hypothetical protein [Lachnospiraceae bacterium]